MASNTIHHLPVEKNTVNLSATGHELVPMGRIINAFGIKGWVKIKPDTHTPDSLSNYKSLQVLINDKWQAKTVVESAVHNDVFSAKFDGVDDRDAALLLRGSIVAVPRHEFPSTATDEYYLVDLMGLIVHNNQQEYLGTVTNFIEAGTNTVLVIKNERVLHNLIDNKQNAGEKTEYLIPFVAQYICDVNLSTKQIVVDWGLDY